jgi:hypothetical protein
MSPDQPALHHRRFDERSEQQCSANGRIRRSLWFIGVQFHLELKIPIISGSSPWDAAIPSPTPGARLSRRMFGPAGTLADTVHRP